MRRGVVAAALAVAGAAALAFAGLRVVRAEPEMLWWQGQTISRATNHYGFVWTIEGELLRFGPRLRVERLPVTLAGRTVVDAAASGDSVWLVDGAGFVLARTRDGTVRELGRTPFDIPALSSGKHGVWAARSPVQFTFRPETSVTPLVSLLDDSLVLRAAADTATQPSNPFLAQLANAGHVLALEDGGAIFAPFIRDEVVRYGRDGNPVWRMTRGLSHGTADPRMLVDSGRVLVDYAPVNLGLSSGPDGHIYVLSTPRATTAESRLDALDARTGQVVLTRALATALPTIAVDRRGRITTPDPDSLLPAPGETVREVFPPFDLPSSESGRTRLADFNGRVTLVNFWASWCAPCREELPALDSLRRSFDTARVAFVALSDDVSVGAARRFLAEHPIGMTIGMGGGRLKGAYHYVGLPYTVLLDGAGRIIRRWSGYTGRGQIETIGELIRDELARGAVRANQAAHSH